MEHSELVCIIPFFHKYSCACVCLHAQSDLHRVYFQPMIIFAPCPVLWAVSFSRWLTRSIFPAALNSLALSLGRGLAAQHNPGRQRALCCLLLPTAPHHTQEKGPSLIWAAQEIKGGGLKQDFRRISLSCFILYNEQENQSKVRGPVYLFFQQFLWCQFTRYYNNGTHGR